jgi:signal transduction histidine kinase
MHVDRGDGVVPQEQPPLESDTGSGTMVPPLATSSTARIQGAPPEVTEAGRQDVGQSPEPATWPPISAAGLRALQSVAAALPRARILRLLAKPPVEEGKGQPPFIEIAAIQADQRLSPAGTLLAKPLDQKALSDLSERVIARISGMEPMASLPHLPGMLVIPCRDDNRAAIGALTVEPDTSSNSAEDLTPAMVGLITTEVLLALELEALTPQIEERLATMATDEARAREVFISFAAHELRAPLTSIKGFAQLLVRQARKNPLPDPMMRSIQSIEQQSGRMAEMLSEMLDASRILRGEIEMLPGTLDLAALIKKVVERRRLMYPEHTMIVIGADSPLTGSWDGVRVEQVLRNLLDNAARHSPAGSTVVLQIARDAHSVVVRVRDQGIGIAEPDRDRLFTYLNRTPDSERRNLAGLGLGLFVSHYLIERMGGRLWLEVSCTTEPSGSEFAFTLPL